MLSGSFLVLGATVVLGLVLATALLMDRPPRGRVWRVLPLLHGLSGLAGLVLVVRQVWAGPGAGGFGSVAGWLLAGALAGGAVIAVSRLRGRRPSGIVVAAHATAGIAGYVVLSAFLSLPR